MAPLRQTLLLWLGDLMAVSREFIHPEASCSALDCCLRCHGFFKPQGPDPVHGHR